ncbi:hypothetical protein K0H71_12720 [Bacillus sp. IITD106]|nr:hypothetical protein [Bacillus sp. IITD106]
MIKNHIREYTDYVIKDMMDMYGIKQDEANQLIKKYNFDKMVEKAPEFVLHYNTEDWAERIYKNKTLQTI